MFDSVTHAGSPSNDTAIETGAKHLICISARIEGRFPGQACDGVVHFLVLNLMHLVTQHGADNLQGAIK